MSSPFNDLPPFPEDLPLAPIAIISHHKLLSGNSNEATKVLEAAKTYGFFYLSLSDTPSGQTLLAESEQLLALAKIAFSLPLPTKLQYALERGVSLFGYKPAGTVKQTDRSQRPDMTEFFNISKDVLHGTPGTTPRSYPPLLVEQHRELLQSFIKHGHDLGMVVLRVLAEQLGLDSDAFTQFNLFDQPSGDHIRLTRKPGTGLNDGDGDSARIGLPSHTDFGSVTILFNWLGGLQIESRTEGRVGEWEWVKPMPGHAIINLGDATALFTNTTLKSAKHRVVPSPGQQASADRYSVVYFVRPHNNALMKPLPEFVQDGQEVMNVAGKFSAGLRGDQVLTAGEWMRLRTVQLLGTD